MSLDLVHLATQELFDRSILNLQLFVLLPDHLIAEVRQAFETAGILYVGQSVRRC